MSNVKKELMEEDVAALEQNAEYHEDSKLLRKERRHKEELGMKM